MTLFRKVLSVALVFSCTCLFAQDIKLKPTEKVTVDIPEPSDVALAHDGKSLFIVSDNGYLFETDLKGKIIRKAEGYKGLDDEGVYADANFVYAVEEFSRTIKLFDLETLTQQRTYEVSYHGGRNKSYEAFTFNKIKNRFLLITEKSPAYLFELNESFEKVNTIDISHIARDISAATFYNGYVWLLSDEDRSIFKLDANTYKVLSQWEIPVLNPEGLAFDADGNIIVVSDAMQKIYYFNNPEN
ncbi:SdiA-regulated domain-containing protein [Fulvivirga maritima]|uniref:SdiA-regulated domain-containing protein n=1 Tax=Fulvivirga maritima TaxID=2904247 RepID=UPI001F300A5F|nr:SdiA-regulated domain-containing protein [Fulvivirga maritima]UII27363.1 SdiA-regulated domain-containing protein [Fulvivirga maritima]